MLTGMEGVNLMVEEDYKDYLTLAGVNIARCSTLKVDDFAGATLAVSLGGDGTLLGRAALLASHATPVVGINTGHLGYLTACRLQESRAVINDIMQGNYSRELRSMLQLVEINGKPCDNVVALNEIAILRQDTTSMIAMPTWINDTMLTTYKGDGLVISTPTGSTAYNMSVGGPIIHPSTGCIALSPISPHSLNMRPIVVPDDSRITITTTTRARWIQVSVDGMAMTLPGGSTMKVALAPYKLTTTPWCCSGAATTLPTPCARSCCGVPTNDKTIMTYHHTMIVPPPLAAGDSVAIVSPAGPVMHERLDGACSAMEALGWQVVEGEHCRGTHIAYDVVSHSAPLQERLADLQRAIHDPRVKAIVCGRGGYGAVHLLPHLDLDYIASHPKWIIGYSDISALHAAWHRAGVVSLHAPMAKQWALHGTEHPVSKAIAGALKGEGVPPVTVPAHPFNRQGQATATITGGNLAVLSGLLATPWNLLKPGNILFIEDVAEQVYQVQRMLYHLRLADILPHLAGLVVGQFTKYRGSENHAMERMISDMVAPYSYPVAFDFPIGHIDDNRAILEGAQATLAVTSHHAALTMELPEACSKSSL